MAFVFRQIYKYMPHQKTCIVSVTVEDLSVVIGDILVSGYAEYPNKYMY